jgi:excisionase family DNA binding protein
MDNLLLRVPEVAHRLGVSRAKVYELISAGRLRSVRIDGCRRVRVSDLEAYVDGLPTAS